MRHVLVATIERHDLLEALRAIAPPSTTLTGENGLENVLERLGRSARIDAVVTDDPEVVTEIFHEIPGGIPVYLARPDEEPAQILEGLDALTAG